MRISNGFTLVELLVVVLVIGILAAIAIPNFVTAAGKSKTASVKAGMHTIQVAAEGYATDAAGSYSSTSAGWLPYLPGGSMTSQSGTPGTIPLNPCTGTTATIGSSGITNVQSARTSTCSTFAPGPGNLSYDVIGGNTSYAICGGDPNGVTVGVEGFKLVFSNQ